MKKMRVLAAAVIAVVGMIALICQSCTSSPYERTVDGVVISLGGKSDFPGQVIRLQVITDRIIRVSSVPSGEFPESISLMTIPQPERIMEFTIEKGDGIVTLSTTSLSAQVSLKTGEIIFTDTEGTVFVAEQTEGGRSFMPVSVAGETGYAVRQQFESFSDEALYGLGANQTSYMNLKGKDADLFRDDSLAVVPFIISNRNYGILWDNNSRSKFGDIRDWCELSGMKLFDNRGNEGGLTAVYSDRQTGKKVFIARHESEINYLYMPDLVKFPEGFDLEEGQVSWEGEFEPETSGAHKFVFTSAGYARLWIDGKLLFDRWSQCRNASTDYFTMNLEQGIHYPVKIEWIPDGSESFIGLKYLTPLDDEEQQGISFWSEEADQIDYYFISGENMDDVISGYRTLTGKAPVMPEWALGSAGRSINADSPEQVRSVFEVQRATDPDNRVFIITRSAFAGLQRYSAANQSCDITARWHDMAAQIPCGLNISMSGIPWWTMDIGGFSVESRYLNPSAADLEEWRELMTRWHQYGTFVPIFRSHDESPDREMYNAAPESHPSYKTMLAYNELRYRLMPYIYSLAGHAWLNDYTIMRGLTMDFSLDTAVFNITDQYMFGPSLMVNPVTEYKARSRRVYLPAANGWYDLRSGRYYKGGEVILAEAPYDYMPLFVREGSIVPFGPEMQNAMEKQADPLTLFVYSGADASFVLYEDEGGNYNYENGAYTLIPFTWSEAEKMLTIGTREGEYPGMLKTRTINLAKVSGKRAVKLDFVMTPDTTVMYTGEEITLQLK